jgi:hypothetical protein
MRVAGGAHVNGHSHSGVLHHKLDHSARAYKIVHVRDRQDAGSLQSREDGREAFILRLADV